MNERDPWSLSKFDLTAKLHACEIELQYTKEELARRNRDIVDCSKIIEKREQQIKAQSRRQRQIENIHKELIHEYEQHVACLKQEVKEIKESHDKLFLKFKELQRKQSAKTDSSSALLSLRLIEATNNIEKFLRNSPRIFYGQTNTLDVLQKLMNGHCIYLCDEMLKRPLTTTKVRILDETVNHFLWLVNETQHRLEEMKKELRMLSSASSNNDLVGIISKNCRDDEDSFKHNPVSNLDWNKILDSKVSIDRVLKEETDEIRELENRIKSYLNVLEKLIEQKPKKQVTTSPFTRQLNDLSQDEICYS